jgi:predicted CXXCH cytochrome family protein
MPRFRQHLPAILGWLLASASHAFPQDFLDPTSCRPCHQRIYEEYLATPMGSSFYSVGAKSLPEDWSVNNRFYHALSESHFEMLRRGDKLIIRRYQVDEGGRQVNSFELPVTHVMGSGTRARSYLHQTAEGRLVELPVSWYSQEKRWAMAPGFDRPKHPGFTRTVNHKCMFCHNAYPPVAPERARQGWDHDVQFPLQLPAGIDCQRCHGPGGQHVRAAAAAESTSRVRAAIVNPARLTGERQLDICMQCHLETTTSRLPESYRRFGRGFYSYRPGQVLSEYIVHFDHAPGTGHDNKFEIVSAAYRLRQSRCFISGEGKLTCTTCHNPHKAVSPATSASHYRARCFQCHSSKDAAKHGLGAPGFSRSDCVSCHMPKRRTEDVVHVVMTDHQIQRRIPARDLLAPLREKTDEEQIYRGEVVLYYPKTGLEAALRQVYLGIAQVKEKVNLSVGLEMLKQALLQTNLQQAEPYFELAEAQAALGQKKAAEKSYLKALELDSTYVQAENNLGNLLAEFGRGNEALKHYRRALELDPKFPDVHLNLGLALRGLGDLPAAEDSFRNAIKADPLYAPGYRDLGSLLLVQGKIDVARSFLERSLAIEPADAKTHNNLGLALLGLGKREEGIAHLRFALRHGAEPDRELTRKTLQSLGVEAAK